MKKLSQYVSSFSGLRVAVLGDVMLDRYIWGRATRISQEAPVPVVQVTRENAVPGGAANVARNVLSLGGKAELLGVGGEDYDGQDLLRILHDAGVGVDGIQVLPDRPTTVKTRVLASNQQVVRIDQEDLQPLLPVIRRKMLDHLEQLLSESSLGALILEDYAKGVFSREFMRDVIRLSQKYGKPVSLDPHPKNCFNVKGLTLMTPNRAEAFALAGVEYSPGCGDPVKDVPLRKVSEILQKKWDVKILLITLGAEGMALFRAQEPAVHIPTVARQVFDVSGAGDTVMATMVLALLAGASPQIAAKIANTAAGVVVGRVGTSAIEADVLMKMLDEASPVPRAKR